MSVAAGLLIALWILACGLTLWRRGRVRPGLPTAPPPEPPPPPHQPSLFLARFRALVEIEYRQFLPAPDVIYSRKNLREIMESLDATLRPGALRPVGLTALMPERRARFLRPHGATDYAEVGGSTTDQTAPSEAPLEIHFGVSRDAKNVRLHYTDMLNQLQVVGAVGPLRRTLAERHGVWLTGIKIRDDVNLGCNEWRILLRGKPVARGDAVPGQYQVVVQALIAYVQGHADELLGEPETELLLSLARHSRPDLDWGGSVAQLCGLLQALLVQRQSIGNLPAIVEHGSRVLAEKRDRSPADLARRVADTVRRHPLEYRLRPLADALGDWDPTHRLRSEVAQAFGYLADPPDASPQDVLEAFHGTEIGDPYRWLEDAGSPRVRDWLHAQDARSYNLLRILSRRKLSQAWREAHAGWLSDPRVGGGRYFYLKAGGVWSRDWVTGQETKLFEASGTIVDMWPSPGGEYVACQVSVDGSETSTLVVVNARTGVAGEQLPGAWWGTRPAWTPADESFYHIAIPTTDAPLPARVLAAQVRLHRVGTEPGSDEVVFCEPDGPPLRAVHVFDEHWLVITHLTGGGTTQAHYRDLRQSTPFRRLDWPGTDGYLVVWNDTLYLFTNWRADRYRICRVDPDADPEQWAEIVPERADATLIDLAVGGGWLALQWLQNAVPYLEICTADGVPVQQIRSPLESIVLLDVDPRARLVHYTVTSFHRPPEVRAVSLPDLESRVTLCVSSPDDWSRYYTQQAFFPSRDGTSLSIFIVSAQPPRRDGTSPTLLAAYGYGGRNLWPEYTPAVVAWIRQGGLYVLANVRGGGEYGWQWRDGGRNRHKQNGIDDFLAVAEFLIHQGYCTPATLAMAGGSAGGLLVAAALTQRPELFGAVVCAGPLTDMVRYHRSGCGPLWKDELGRPDDPEDGPALYRYSPYHQLQPGVCYPPTLILSSDNDERTDPLHARKFAARLQACTSGGPVLLHTQRNRGHQRSFLEIDALAFVLAFLPPAPK